MDLKLEAALDTRDALAKSIYAALFRCSQLTPGGAWHGCHSDCHRDRLRLIVGNVSPVTATEKPVTATEQPQQQTLEM